MQFLRSSYQSAFAQSGCVATIGSFDSLHIGHQTIISRLKTLAEQLQAPSVVVFFEPLPEEFFRAETTRLYTLRERLNFLSSLGVSYTVCLRFSKAFASMSPLTFIKTILIDGLNIRGMVIGPDFRFGKQRAGDFHTLEEAAVSHHFVLEPIPIVKSAAQRISSTQIREFVRAGDFEQAEQLLGRPFEISGRVVHGDKQGTLLGFPTANIAHGRVPTPLRGVYTGTVVSMTSPLPCLVNAGYRPTFSGDQYRLEVHIPDFSASLYGQRLGVRLHSKIREERKFDSGDALKHQIHHDIKALNRAVNNERV